VTTTRHPGTAPIFRAFSELSGLPPAERREALMLRLEHVWDQASNHSYVTKKGDEVHSPDGTLQLKVIQAVAVLQGLTGQAAEAEEAALAKMSDADLLREATKRLPPHEIAALADQLIAMREQQTQKQAIVTTGETTHERLEEDRQRDTLPAPADGDQAPASGPEWA
jgi:hypothetical protein